MIYSVLGWMSVEFFHLPRESGSWGLRSEIENIDATGANIDNGASQVLKLNWFNLSKKISTSMFAQK